MSRDPQKRRWSVGPRRLAGMPEGPARQFDMLFEGLAGLRNGPVAIEAERRDGALEGWVRQGLDPGLPITAHVRALDRPGAGGVALGADLLVPATHSRAPLVDTAMAPEQHDPRLWACGLVSRAAMHVHVGAIMGAVRRARPIQWRWGPWDDGLWIIFSCRGAISQDITSVQDPRVPFGPGPAAIELLAGNMVGGAARAAANHHAAVAVAAAMAAELGGGHEARDGVIFSGRDAVFDANGGPPGSGHPLHRAAMRLFDAQGERWGAALLSAAAEIEDRIRPTVLGLIRDGEPPGGRSIPPGRP